MCFPLFLVRTPCYRDSYRFAIHDQVDVLPAAGPRRDGWRLGLHRLDARVEDFPLVPVIWELGLAMDPPIAMHVTTVIIISIENAIPRFRNKRCRVAVRPGINRRLRLRRLLRGSLRGVLRGFVLRRAVGVVRYSDAPSCCFIGPCGRLSRPPCGGLVSWPTMESHHGARSGDMRGEGSRV